MRFRNSNLVSLMKSTGITREPGPADSTLNRINRSLVLSVLIIIMAGTILTIGTAVQTDRQMREDLLVNARIGFAGMNITGLAGLTGSPADLESPVYLAIKTQLSEIRSADPKMRFVYLIGRRSDGTYFFLADSEPPGSADYSPPGQEYPEVSPPVISVYTGGGPLTEGPASDRWGTWVSALVPVNDPASGNRIAVFGIDRDARDWVRQIVLACLTPFAGTLLVLALVLSFFLAQQRNRRERMTLEQSRRVLQESEERYRLLFTQSPLGIIHVDRDGVVLTANRKFLDITGTAPEEITGFRISGRFGNPGFSGAIRTALDGAGGFFEGDFSPGTDGRHRILRMICQPVGTRDDRISGAICMIEDITDRWEAEQKDREENAFFARTQQALMQLSRLPADDLNQYFDRLISTDAETLGIGRVSVWWFSDDQSELTCAALVDRDHTPDTTPLHLRREDYPRYFRALDENRIIAAHDARSDERTAEFTESYLVPLNITSMLDIPIRRGERLAGILCHEHTGERRHWNPLEQDFAVAVADLVSAIIERTERMAAETALRESEQRYRNVVEDQTELIMRYLPDGTLVFVNDAFCRFFRRERARVIGEKFSPRTPDGDTENVSRHLTALSRNVPIAELTHRVLRPDGQVAWLSWTSRALYDDEGKITEIQSVGRDITAQKQTEEALSLVNQKLGLLSSVTRHDAINQLLVLRGFLKLAETLAEKPEEVRRFLSKALKALLTIEAQINFTRDYQDMGVAAPSWQGIRKTIVSARGALPPLDIRIETEYPEIEIRADRLLEKVFYNLFDNAIRYGGEKMKTIRISSRESADGLIITVEDDGTGISPEDKARLFTRGFGKNTGFGLFLSREILSISGISITETGTFGQGARFEIFVPRGNFRYPG